MMSAFWHGFYPGYYTMFFGFALVGEITKDFYKSWILFKSIPEPIRKLGAWVFTQNALGYYGCTFMALTLDNTKAFLKSTNYIGIIVLISTLVLVRGLGLVQIA